MSAAGKYTTGKWVVRVAANGSSVAVVSGETGAVVALTKSDHPDTKGRKKDNAHLIASAPDLLAAAKNLSAVYDGIYVKMSDEEMNLCREAWAEMESAIAKAEGRS